MPEKTDLYGLIGHPVGHSRSPLIHRLFAEQCGQVMDYVLLDAAPGSFDQTVTGDANAESWGAYRLRPQRHAAL